MRLHDDFHEPEKGNNNSVAAIFSIAAILLILTVVLIVNADKLKRKFHTNNTSFVATVSIEAPINEEPDVFVPSDNPITVSDLDFYEMYKETDEESEEISVSVEQTVEEEESLSEETDGKHTKVILRDNSVEWVPIAPNVSKSSYDYTNLVEQGGRMKYFEDDKVISSFGVDISKDQDYIDFNKLKKAGCDFVMIRVGQRGYQSGQLVFDDYYLDNLKRANDAGLFVGLYFISSAVTEDEAKEEADFVINSISGYKVDYPVAFVMKFQENDVSRIDALTKDERTKIAKAFMNKIKEAGLKPMIYGDKLWLVKYIDLVSIATDYDTWYSEPGATLPDYPYKFAMWQYNDAGVINGISGTVNLNISFCDYSMK